MKAQYFQTVERIFLESTGRGLVISESDMGCIERWFSTGVPLDVVGRGVTAACKGRETPVRSLSLANRDVEKYFKAWKSRQVGADRTVITSYVTAFDDWFKGLVLISSTSAHTELKLPLEQTLEVLRTLRSQTSESTLLQSGLLRAESILYDAVWEQMKDPARLELMSSVSEIFDLQRAGPTESRDEQRKRMRNKKLRQGLSLPAFEIQLDGGW